MYSPSLLWQLPLEKKLKKTKKKLKNKRAGRGGHRVGIGHICLKGWGGSRFKNENLMKVSDTFEGWVSSKMKITESI